MKGLFSHDLTEGVLFLDVLGLDGLGGDRADLLADDAGDLHGMRQAAAAVEEGGAKTIAPALLELALAELLLDGDLRMAPVGQTSEHSVHLSWQCAMLKFSTGVHKPSTPASSKVAGCRTLVGQTLMHWSHLMHFSRNSLSSTEPGGLISLGEKFSSVLTPWLLRKG